MDNITNNAVSGANGATEAQAPAVSNPNVGVNIQPQPNAPTAPAAAQPAVQTTVPEHNDPWAAFSPTVTPTQQPVHSAPQDPWAAFQPQNTEDIPHVTITNPNAHSADPSQQPSDQPNGPAADQQRPSDQLRAWANKGMDTGTAYGNILPIKSQMDKNGETINGTQELAAPQIMRGMARGFADLMDMMDDTSHQTKMTPDALNVLTLLSPGFGGAAKATQQAMIGDRVAAANKDMEAAASKPPAPTPGLERDVSQINPDQPIAPYKNAIADEEKPTDTAADAASVKQLQDTEAQIQHIKALGTPDAAGKAQLAALEAKSDDLRTQLVGDGPKPIPEKPPATTPPTLGLSKEEAAAEPVRTLNPKPVEHPLSPSQALAKAYKDKSQAGYGSLHENEQVLDKDAVNSTFNSMMVKPGQSAVEQISAKDDPVAPILAKYAGARDEPLTLAGARILDRELGDHVSAAYKSGDMTSAQRLMSAKDALMDAIKNAPASAGLAQAKDDWATSAQVSSIAKMLHKADGSPNESTVLQTYLRHFRANPANTRGWSPEALNALDKAVDVKSTTELLKAVGNKLLVPAAALSEGATHGITGGIAGATVAHLLTRGAKRTAAGMTKDQVQKLIDVLDKHDLSSTLPKQPGLLSRTKNTAGSALGAARSMTPDKAPIMAPGLLNAVNTNEEQENSGAQ